MPKVPVDTLRPLTAGYGDIVSKTSAGRVAGLMNTFTGIALLGVLAGSLADA